MHGIERDVDRFRQIIRGKIKQNLKKYMSQDGIEVFGKEGKHKIHISLPHIELPRFVYGNPGSGVGQGQGDQAADDPAENAMEIDVTLEEMAELLSEELELPNIQKKGKSDIQIDSDKYRTIRAVGPESLLHRKKTFLRSMKRSIASGDYNPDDPVIIPVKEDKRYRAPKPIFVPHYQCVIIYIIDVSGSMGEHEKEMSRLTSFWIDLWLRSQYENLKTRYIIHNEVAREVDQHTFYHTAEGGGTRIASAYELAKNIILEEYPFNDWNIYIFQFSDGDDWGGASNSATNIIADLLPGLNQVSYCQVKEHGDFKKTMSDRFASNPNVVVTTAYQKDQILTAIKEFFKKGN